MRLVFTLRSSPPPPPPAGRAPPNAPLAWRLTQLEMFCERRPARPDDPGCQIDSLTASDSEPLDGWSRTSPLAADAQTGGYWEAVDGATLNILPGRPARLLPVPFWALSPRPQWSVASRHRAGLPCSLLRLPLGCWAYVEQATPRMLIVEAGRLLPTGRRQVASVSFANGARDTVVLGEDGELSLAEARAKGYLQSDDPKEQAYYNELMEVMDMDSDATANDGVLTEDATLYSDTGGALRDEEGEEEEREAEKAWVADEIDAVWRGQEEDEEDDDDDKREPRRGQEPAMREWPRRR
jgi:hypothetical protein